MNTEQIISVVVAILTGLSACIPLAYKLIQYVKKATQEKNWAALLGLVISLMEEAETKFTDGATRKEWVMAMVQTSAEYINYPVDVTALGELIDALCGMTKVVNFEEIPVQLQAVVPGGRTDRIFERNCYHYSGLPDLICFPLRFSRLWFRQVPDKGVECSICLYHVLHNDTGYSDGHSPYDLVAPFGTQRYLCGIGDFIFFHLDPVFNHHVFRFYQPDPLLTGGGCQN